VNGAALSPDGKNFVVGCTDGAVRSYDFENGKENEVLKGHHGPVHCVRYAPDGNTFASASEDGTLRLNITVLKNYGLWVVQDPNPKSD